MGTTDDITRGGLAAWLGLVAVAASAFAWLLLDGGGGTTGAVLGDETTSAVREFDGMPATDVVGDTSPASPAVAMLDDAPRALATPVDDDATMFGRVVDEDGAPISGARVRAATAWIEDGPAGREIFDTAVHADRLGRAWTTACDADGRWSLTLPDDALPGPPRPGGRTALLLAFDAPGRCTHVSTWQRERDVGTVALDPGAWLVGRVIDERGEPVADARVWVRATGFGFRSRDFSYISWPPVEGWSSVATDAGGRFTSPAIRPGEAQARVDGRCVTRDLSFDTVLGANDVGDLRVWRGGVMTGVVRDDAGAPVTGARVTVANGAPNVDEQLARHASIVDRTEADTTTDASGAFTLYGLRHADLWVTAAGPPALGVDSARATLADGAAHVELFLPRAAPLDVTLVAAETGRPLDLDDVTVTAIAVANDDTEAGVPAGATEIAPGVVRLWSPGTIGTRVNVEMPGRAPVERRVPADVRAVTIALEECVVLEGRIVDFPGPDPAVVAAHRERDGDTHWTYTRDGGRFRLEPLTTGRWHLTTHGGEWESFGILTVDVAAPGVVDGLEIEVGGVGALRVELVPPGARAFGLTAEHVATGDEITTSGLAFGALAPGTWRITGQGIEATQAEVVADELTVVRARTLGLPRVVGTVTRDGEPVASGSVVVGEDFVDVAPDGTFEHPAKREGSWRIAWIDDDACFVHAEPVELRWGETLRRDLALDAGLHVEITVRDAVTGAPRADVPIVARTDGIPVMPLGRTDATGVLRAGPLDRRATIATGRRHAGFTRDEAALPPDAAGIVALELRIRATGRLELRPSDDALLGTSTPLTARFESATHGEVVSFPAVVGRPILDAPVGAWRVVAVPAWLDVDAVPLGVGTLVAIEHGVRTTVDVPLTYPK